MTRDEVAVLVIEGMNHAVYRETDSSLYDSDMTLGAQLAINRDYLVRVGMGALMVQVTTAGWSDATVHIAIDVPCPEGRDFASFKASISDQLAPIDATYWLSNGWRPIASALAALPTLW